MATIKVEHYDKKIELTFSDELVFDELADMFANISLQMGYTRETVDRYIINLNTADTHTIIEREM